MGFRTLYGVVGTGTGVPTLIFFKARPKGTGISPGVAKEPLDRVKPGRKLGESGGCCFC